MKSLFNTKKVILYLLAIVSIFLSISITSFANDIATLEEPPVATSPFDQIIGDTLPKDVSFDKVNGWIDQKGEDIFSVLQKVAQWISIICFAIFAVKGIFGLFGRGDMLPQALMGCAWTVVVYSVVTYVPQLLELGKQWLLNGL